MLTVQSLGVPPAMHVQSTREKLTPAWRCTKEELALCFGVKVSCTAHPGDVSVPDEKHSY